MVRRIRVLELVTDFAVEGSAGGVGRFAIELARALDNTQIDRIIGGLWYYNTPGEIARIQQLQAEGIKTLIGSRWDERASYLNVYSAFQGLLKALSHDPVDIIHSHSEFSDFPAVILRHFTHKPALVRTLHNHEWRRRPLLRPFAQMLYPLVYDIELGISQHVVESLNRRWVAKWLGRRAVYAPNAIDIKRFELTMSDVSDLRQALNIPTTAAVVGTVGRLSEQKGYSILLEAVPVILAQEPQTCFLLVGTGELESELKRQAQKLGIASHVLFTGPRTDVEALFRCMDLFVSSSLWEGLPTVVLESMAASIPVVATNIPGTRDLIQDGISGWLVPPANPRALGDTIVRALRNPKLRQTFAHRAKQLVSAFSIETVAAAHVSLYRTLACSRRML